MTKKEAMLDRLYVASPCSADWDAMPGNEQFRFCNQCQLNVYNLSAMTRKQAEELIAKAEGRLCTKLYRRADGTIITADCPVGLRAMKRKVSRAASATLSAILGFLTNQTIVWADDGHKNCTHYTAKIVRLQSGEKTSLISGTVSDTTDAVIPKAQVTLINRENKRTYAAETDNEGKYEFLSVPAGNYAITIGSPGFHLFKKDDLKTNFGEALRLNVTLQVGSTGGAAFLPGRKGKTTKLA